MAKIRNVSGEDRITGQPPRLVLDGAVFTLPDDDPYGVFGYTQQLEVWEPADADANRVHEENLEAIAYHLAEQEVSEEVVADPEDAVEKSARELIADVIPLLDAEALGELAEAEATRTPQRSTVLAAIEKRATELADPDPDNPGGDGPGGDNGQEG